MLHYQGAGSLDSAKREDHAPPVPWCSRAFAWPPSGSSDSQQKVIAYTGVDQRSAKPAQDHDDVRGSQPDHRNSCSELKKSEHETARGAHA